MTTPPQAGFGALLHEHSFQLCGEASNGKEAIEKVIELRPDIVLLDIRMPELNGVKAAYEIRRISPDTKFVFLTVHSMPGVVRGTRLWSHGFVSKSKAAIDLVPTLNRVAGITDDGLQTQAPWLS